MSLPILQTHAQPGPADFVRFYHRTELHWTRHLAEETTLDVGTAFANPELSGIWDANRLLDAALNGKTPKQAAEEVDTFFASVGTRCWSWVLNPSATPSQEQPLAEYLMSAGLKRLSHPILRLAKHPAKPIGESSAAQIIPARASFKLTRQLMEQSIERWTTPQRVDAALLHLDDPHWDALLALIDGEPAGYIGVLAVGDVGRIETVFVAQKFRRQGIGRTLMSRAMEICARSLFKHVLIGVEADNESAKALYAQCGFESIGEFVWYQATEC